MTQQNMQLSSQVNSQQLDVMYNNFVKIVDWIIKGSASTHQMPPALADLFAKSAEVETLKAQVAQLQEQVAQLQEQLAKTNHTQPAFPPAVGAPAGDVMQDLSSFGGVGEPVAPAPVAPAPVAPAPVAPAPVAPAPVAPAPVAPTSEPATINEQIKVSAEAVDAGNLYPDAMQALDNELDSIIGNINSLG